MCGRYTLTPAIDELLQQLGLAPLPAELTPRYNIAPTQMVPALLKGESGEAFAFAGLWERWMPGENEEKQGEKSGSETVLSCAIITSDVCEALRGIHHRMPVVMKRDRWDAWLDPDVSVESLQAMLLPYAGDDLKVYSVSTLVNSPMNDRQECIFPLDQAAER